MPMIEFEIVDDQRSLVIGFRRGPDLPVAYMAKFATDDVDKLLQNVGLWRTGMQPRIPEKWESQRVTAYRNPTIMIESDQLAGDVMLHIRNERFGWLHFVITKSIAADLAKQFAAITQAPAPPVQGSA